MNDEVKSGGHRADKAKLSANSDESATIISTHVSTDTEAATITDPGTSVTLEEVEDAWGAALTSDLSVDMTVKPQSDPAQATHSSIDLHELHLVEGDAPAEPPAHYRLREVLGEGGMGVVYEAEQTSFARTVAVKMVIGKQNRAHDAPPPLASMGARAPCLLRKRLRSHFRKSASR